MNSKSSVIQDKSGSTPADLKKLYSSHVLENTTLQRQKSDIENAKQKKLRELNFNASAFLRKYDKYTNARTSAPRARRGSVDVGLVRALELNRQSRPSTSCTTREDITKTKSLGRDSINNDCPYSLETWNILVGNNTNIIEDFKREILFGESEKQRSNSDGELNESSEHIENTDTMHSINDSRLLRRRTLKPLNVENSLNNFNDDELDAEIMEIQNRGKVLPRGRRHSVIGVSTSRKMSVGTGAMKLPSIESSLRNTDKMKSSSDEMLTKSSSIEDLRSLKVTTKRRSTSFTTGVTDPPKLSIHSPVPEVNTPDTRPNQRPVANAAVFVQGDHDKIRKPDNLIDNNNDTSETENDSMCETSSVSDVLKSARSDRSGNSSSSFLPAISTNGLKVSQSDTKPLSATKRVQFLDSPIEEQSECDNLAAKSSGRQRRPSLTTTTLKLLVDSHHGAAKLRYIAKLATEMEKEEAAKHTPPNSPEPNPYEQLSNCRYLRVQHRQDSFVDSC